MEATVSGSNIEMTLLQQTRGSFAINTRCSMIELVPFTVTKMEVTRGRDFTVTQDFAPQLADNFDLIERGLCGKLTSSIDVTAVKPVNFKDDKLPEAVLRAKETSLSLNGKMAEIAMEGEYTFDLNVYLGEYGLVYTTSLDVVISPSPLQEIED